MDTTDDVEKLAQASAVSKMPRPTEDRVISDFMKRVEEANANADYMYRISAVIV